MLTQSSQGRWDADDRGSWLEVAKGPQRVLECHNADSNLGAINRPGRVAGSLLWAGSNASLQSACGTCDADEPS